MLLRISGGAFSVFALRCLTEDKLLMNFAHLGPRALSPTGAGGVPAGKSHCLTVFSGVMKLLSAAARFALAPILSPGCGELAASRPASPAPISSCGELASSPP